ncbi:MAG: hypothetical protein AUK47_19200 [Deltaproteobacteria bacterium CG2_30_63_29]|nr:MAG: hypothetical protein AUK47_19200 [Deltaproteobacteria bacterium CG2_30_63_29]PJB38963.1 MAG: hypothetical protein CO108_18155 [Deltaproteobacteria bacterium CG_4_9_14_3_um_filter_63_12]
MTDARQNKEFLDEEVAFALQRLKALNGMLKSWSEGDRSTELRNEVCDTIDGLRLDLGSLDTFRASLDGLQATFAELLADSTTVEEAFLSLRKLEAKLERMQEKGGEEPHEEISNRISFNEIGNEIEHAFDLSFLTQSDEFRRLRSGQHQALRGASMYEGFDALDLRWLASDEMEVLDKEIARATEVSGLHVLPDGTAIKVAEIPGLPTQFERTPSGRKRPKIERTGSGLLPTSGVEFEDSGLFAIFVEEPEEADDELEFDIDIIPPTALTDAEMAYREFVQHLNRIVLRMFESLELVLIHERYEELFDVYKQLNRTARLLDFVELDVQLPLLVYLQELLPLCRAQWLPRLQLEFPPWEVDTEELPTFLGNRGEVLDCLLYLLGFLVYEVPGIERDTFEGIFVEFYARLEITPGEPSEWAPLGPYGHDDGLKITSRARRKLARGLDDQFARMLDGIESSMLYGKGRGYVRSQNACLEILRETEDLELSYISAPIAQLSRLFGRLRALEHPPPEVKELLSDVLRSFTEILPQFKGTAILERLRALVERVSFSERARTGKVVGLSPSPQSSDFRSRWPKFREEAAPQLDALLGVAPLGGLVDTPPMQESLARLRDLAAKHKIRLLDRLLVTLQEYWNQAPHACSHVLEDLAASIRALPIDGAQETHLKALAQSVVADLIEGRRNSIRTPRHSSEEVSTVVLKMVARLDALTKKVAFAARSDDPSVVAAERKESHELAELARSRSVHSVALSCEVIAELAGISLSKNSFDQELLVKALRDTNEAIEIVLNDVVENIDNLDESSSGVESIDAFFALWKKGHGSSSWSFETALRSAAARLLKALETLWRERADGQLFDRPAAETYLVLLDELHQLTWYWGRAELNAQVSHHRSLFSSTHHALNGIEALRRQFEVLVDELVSALPEPRTLPYNEGAERFLELMKRWSVEVTELLDDGFIEKPLGPERSMGPWVGLTAERLESMVEASRKSLCAPYLALVCELRDIMVQAAGERSGQRSLERLRLLLYWTRTFLSIFGDRRTQAEELTPKTSPILALRYDASEITTTMERIESLSAQVQHLESLFEMGPLTFTSKVDKETLTELCATVSAISTRIGGGSLEGRMLSIAKRLAYRASFADSVIQVQTGHFPELDPVALPPLIQSMLASIVEELGGSIIDMAFEGTQHGLLRLNGRTSDKTLSIRLAHDGQVLDAMTIFESADEQGHSPTNGSLTLVGASKSKWEPKGFLGSLLLRVVESALFSLSGALHINAADGLTNFVMEVPLRSTVEGSEASDEPS